MVPDGVQHFRKRCNLVELRLRARFLGERVPKVDAESRQRAVPLDDEGRQQRVATIKVLPASIASPAGAFSCAVTGQIKAAIRKMADSPRHANIPTPLLPRPAGMVDAVGASMSRGRDGFAGSDHP